MVVKNNNIVFNIDNNNKKNVSWELNQHITISVGSCDCLKTGEIAAENSALIELITF